MNVALPTLEQIKIEAKEYKEANSCKHSKALDAIANKYGFIKYTILKSLIEKSQKARNVMNFTFPQSSQNRMPNNVKILRIGDSFANMYDEMDWELEKRLATESRIMKNIALLSNILSDTEVINLKEHNKKYPKLKIDSSDLHELFDTVFSIEYNGEIKLLSPIVSLESDESFNKYNVKLAEEIRHSGSDYKKIKVSEAL